MIARKVSTLHRRIVFQDVDRSPSICLLSLFVRNILIVLTEAQLDWNSNWRQDWFQLLFCHIHRKHVLIRQSPRKTEKSICSNGGTI